MAKIEVTPEQKKELASRGFLAKPVTDIVSNRRYYWDPRKDESGSVMGWTRPLPGDTLRMNFYLSKGFKLEDPDGNQGPPPGYFRKGTPPMAVPTKKILEVGTGSGEIGQKVAQKGDQKAELKCPLCQKDFPDADTLVHHMIYHRSKAKKVKAKKSKRGKSQKSKKIGVDSPEGG